MFWRAEIDYLELSVMYSQARVKEVQGGTVQWAHLFCGPIFICKIYVFNVFKIVLKKKIKFIVYSR